MDAEMEFEAFSNLTDIQRFFYGQTVFLTGVTGLLGKVVLEKILRCCPGIGMVYIQIRPKRGLTPAERLDKIFKLELFRKLKEVFPLFRKKVQVIEGNIIEKRFGMSLEDYEKICQNVTVVIHSAASVNFNDPLRISVAHNLIASKNMIEMCHDIKNIKSIVHVSTAFVKREADGSVLEEVPENKVKPEELMQALEWMDDKSTEAVSEFLTENILTTYLVTKALAEELIAEKRGDLPVAIVRPSYISPTHKEPFPGWVDNIQGISGLLLAGAKGVLRTLKSIKGLKINIVPVDLVANIIVSSAWHVGVTRPAPLFIINAVLPFERLPNGDEEILQFALTKRDEYPLVNMFRYPHFTIHYNDYAYKIHAFFDHWIPAAVVDSLLYVFTGRTVLFKVYNKIEFLYGIFYRLGKDPWICRTDNYNFIRDKLSEEDAEIFWMKYEDITWEAYLDNCLYGGRKFLAREDPSNIPYAKKKAYIWWTVTTILKWFLILYFFYYLFTSSFFEPLYKNIEEKVYDIHS